MDYLFSPWRYQYLTAPRPNPGNCVLCAQLAAGDDRAHLIVYRGSRCAVMLNRYPYTTGHVLLLPYAHCATLNACGAETRAELMELAARSEAILTREYNAGGLNVGLNLGEAAGAGIAAHLHLHALPRWTGDANFMTVVGETRVLPEMLDQTFERLRRAYAEDTVSRTPAP